jgi:hypothetical protein
MESVEEVAQLIADRITSRKEILRDDAVTGFISSDETMRIRGEIRGFEELLTDLGFQENGKPAEGREQTKEETNQ